MTSPAKEEQRPRVTVLLVDNRDSFTLNLAHAFADIGADVAIVDGDWLNVRTDFAEIAVAFAPDLVCIGPGPRGPKDLPALVHVVRELDGRLPLFGVCLGMQALTLSRGGRVERAAAPVHGMQRDIHHEASRLFADLPSPLAVMRYHSLICADVPPSLRVVARSADGEPMAVEAIDGPALAVQFHPESVGTRGGLVMLRNVIRCLAGESIVASWRPSLGRSGAVPPAAQPPNLSAATADDEREGTLLRLQSPPTTGAIFCVAPQIDGLSVVAASAAERLPPPSGTSSDVD